MENLATIVVADSKFLGFVKAIQTISDAIAFQKALKNSHSDAAHCPLGWIMLDDSKLETDSKEGFDEDGEPPNSVGPSIVNELKEWKKRQSLVSTSPQFFCEGGLAIVVVRYFGHRLLGVTCGRLSQCYESACKILLHRFTHGDGVPLVQEYKNHDTADKSIYGLCAGDTELIFNVVPSASHDERNTDDLNKIIEELQFGAFKGSLKESLPRLQNLQADIFNDIIPIYRYPGNYNGDEWQTFEWSPTSLDLRNIVETALLPLTKQSMNHCVTNYYRDGKDFIAHHSDKDLDLNKDGVIVSLSLGEERVMEFRKRDKPNDVTRILLPHGSMLVMGPNTNKYFTHSILQKPDSAYPRLSLTFRNVTTFMDENSGFCYGEGVELKSKVDVQKTRRKEDTMFLLGFCSLSTLFCSKKKEFAFHTLNNLSFAGIFFASSFMYRYVRKRMRKRYEEKLARIFFSKTSLSGTKY